MKKVEYIPLEKTKAFGALFLNYLQQKVPSSWYHFEPSLEGIEQAVQQKSFSPSQREVLQRVLNEQYASYNCSEAFKIQLNSIAHSNTYYITTGQQIHVLGGPMYVLLKIATVIQLAKVCKERMPDKHFVPVFWMATEDHDIEEINHLQLFGKEIRVDLNHIGFAGEVPTAEIKTWLASLKDIPEVFSQAYEQYNNLADATRYWVHHLFQDHGLVVFDGNHAALKQMFIPQIEQELFAGMSNEVVQERSQEIVQAGYKAQIFSRPINLFYTTATGRHRIEFVKDHYEIVNTNLRFDQYQIREELHAHPERFSPNVVLRPLYEECILPNVAYIGGPAEVAYWLQLGKVFEKNNMKMPVIFPRNFATIINKPIQSKIQKLGLAYEELFESVQDLKPRLLEHNAIALPEWDQENEQYSTLWNLYTDKVNTIDAQLKPWLEAEKSKIDKAIQAIQKRLTKTVEVGLEQDLKSLETIKEKLFPQDVLQERKESFLTFLINDSEFVNDMVLAMNPMRFEMHMISNED